MKHLKTSIYSLLILGTVHAQKKPATAIKNTLYAGESTVTVNVSKLADKTGKYYLAIGRDQDSSTITDGKLHFTKKLEEPTVAYLMYRAANADPQSRLQSKDYYTFYLTPGTTEIVTDDSIAGAKILHENAFQKDYAEINAKQKAFNNAELKPLMEEYKVASQQSDKAKAEAIGEKFDSLQTAFKENTIKPFIISKGKTSPVALTFLQDYIGYSVDYATINPLYEALNPTLKALPTGKEIGEKLALAKSTQIGQPAIDFTQNDTLGKPVKLSDFKGKYVLVDFWASWCGPCRGENPNVVEAFNKYKDKNFTILGVSFDGGNTRTTKEAWLNAIHADHLTWNHVSDLQGWSNAVGKLYGIQSIPQNILVDPKGNIVAKNIRGEELQKTLAGIF